MSHVPSLHDTVISSHGPYYIQEHAVHMQRCGATQRWRRALGVHALC